VDPLIAQVIGTDPADLGSHSAVWTAPLLKRYLQDHHAIEVSRKTVSRAIARLEIRWKRPRHQLALRPEHWRQSKGGSNAG
jgi:transposase